MRIVILCGLLLPTVLCFGQNATTSALPSGDFTSDKPSIGATSLRSDYHIGSDDQLDIEVFDIMELKESPRVTASGMISLKMIGSVQAGGLTPQELERVIEKALKDKELVNEPHVTVNVREFASQPVSVMGAVRKPGIYQIQGQKSLFGMISKAEGLDNSTVGSTIQVIRAREVIAIDISDFQRGNIALDIPIYANDTINVLTAESVFVLGEARNPGEHVLRNGVNISVLKALAKSGDTTKEAKKKAAMIIRVHTDKSREEIPIDLDKIAKGKSPDVEMMPNDILFVPSSKTKTLINSTLQNAISVVSGRLIYR